MEYVCLTHFSQKLPPVLSSLILLVGDSHADMLHTVFINKTRQLNVTIEVRNYAERGCSHTWGVQCT
jgi:hypothetical protein